MKKLLTIAAALLIASNAFAQEEKKGPDFTYGARAWVFGVMAGQDDFKEDYSHVRIRPMFTLGMEDVKIVTQLEMSQYFGRAADSGGTSDYSGPTSRNYKIKIREAYVDAKNVIMPGLSLAGGVKGYKFPWVIDNEYGLFTAGYNFGMGTANLSYIKINEYNIVEQTDAGDKQNEDAQAYLLDVSVKVDDNITVRPAVMFIQGGKDVPAGGLSGSGQNANNLYGTSLINAAVNVTGKVDIVSFNVTGAYLTGTLQKDAATDDKLKTSAYLFDLGVDAKATDMIKIGAFFTYGSGAGDKADKDNDYIGNMEMIFGRPTKSDGIGYGRLLVLEGASLIRNGGPYEDTFAMDTGLGYMSYGINVEAKIDKLTLFAQFGMASTIDDDPNGKTSIGSEIDVRVSYAIASKTSLFLECGYVLAGDIQFNSKGDTTKDPENMYQIAWGITSQI